MLASSQRYGWYQTVYCLGLTVIYLEQKFFRFPILSRISNWGSLGTVIVNYVK